MGLHNQLLSNETYFWLAFLPQKKHGELKNRLTVTSKQTQEIVNINAQVE